MLHAVQYGFPYQHRMYFVLEVSGQSLFICNFHWCKQPTQQDCDNVTDVCKIIMFKVFLGRPRSKHNFNKNRNRADKYIIHFLTLLMMSLLRPIRASSLLNNEPPRQPFNPTEKSQQVVSRVTAFIFPDESGKWRLWLAWNPAESRFSWKDGWKPLSRSGC